jgi:hypothetical protein
MSLKLVQQQIDRLIFDGESLYIAHPLNSNPLLEFPGISKYPMVSTTIKKQHNLPADTTSPQ